MPALPDVVDQQVAKHLLDELTHSSVREHLFQEAADLAAVKRERPLRRARRQEGSHLELVVEVAVTPQERAVGLMHRRELAADRGMIFDFGSEQNVTMWMRNTYLPLDMQFIDSGGAIRHIAKRTTPLSERTISSQIPVRYVLEINGGLADKLKIAIGDKVSGAGLVLP